MWFRTSKQLFFQEGRRLCPLVIKHRQRSLKALTAYANKDEQIWTHGEIPTPKRLPILGTTLDIIAAGSAKKFHEYVDQRHKELGPIFRETIGSAECVFLSDAQMMREVFLYEGKHPKHPIPDAWLIYQQEHDNKRGLLFMDGDEWLHHRKIMNQIFLSRDIEDRPIEMGCDEVIAQWFELCRTGEGGEAIVPSLEMDMYKLSIGIVMNFMLGPSHVNKSPELQQLVDQFTQDVHLIFKYSAEMFIAPKLLKLIKSKSWTQFVDVVNRTLSLGNQITDYCLESVDLTGGFLRAMQDTNMSREYINRIFVDLIIAAGDTTAFSSQWALYLLGKSAETQEQIYKNLQADGNKESTLMRGIVKETLRLYPVAPFIGRVLPEDAVIGNYRINKNTMVVLSLFTSGRDTANFKEPNTFCPMRWDRKSVESAKTIKPQASIPFAMGSRSCPGQRIAIKQMNIFLSNVIENFRLEVVNETEIEPILQMVTVPHANIKLKLTPRKGAEHREGATPRS